MARATLSRCAWGAAATAAALAVLVTGRAGAVTGAEVVEQVQRRFAQHRTFSARFEKELYWAALDRRQTLRGRIFTSRPNRFRLETDGGDLVVADGQAIWVYDRRNQQVVVGPYAESVRTPWDVLLDYQARFVAGAAEEVRLNGQACYLVSLRRGEATSEVDQLRVWVGARDGRLAQVEQLETGGDVTTYRLKEYRVNPSLDAALFRFEPPSGVRVIDRRGAQGGGG